jgi:hypothetical protein
MEIYIEDKFLRNLNQEMGPKPEEKAAKYWESKKELKGEYNFQVDSFSASS